jgi:hypothetical protein
MRFFFFGTLLDDEVVRIVIGRNVSGDDKRPGTLRGYRRVKAEGVTYPIVVPYEGYEVSGQFVSGITPEEAKLLIAYEGANYDLVLRNVIAAGRERPALVFVPVAHGGLAALDQDWSYEEWLREHRDGFVARLKQWKMADRAV